jgi:predicted Zn-dependent peptidase
MVRAALRHLAFAPLLAAALVAAAGFSPFVREARGSDAGGAGGRASLPDAPALPVTVSRLANGLEVVLHEDHRSPLVTVDVWYHVGSKDEAAGRSGFAHLFEHVMFQGSKHVPEDSYVRYLERAGATDVNGTTHTDRTAYHETVPASRLELALWLESDRMGFLLPHVDGQTFAVQRDVVKNELRQSYEGVPYGMVGSYIRAALYPEGHPYHLPSVGDMRDLDAATVGDVRAFFEQWYVPANATLVVAGDIEPARAAALIEKYFGPIVGRPVPRRRTAPPPVLTQEKRLDVRAGVELARVYVTWPTAPFFAPGDGELDLIARVLAAGKTSRLYKRLVYDLRIAEDVSATQSSAELGSMFEIAATAQPGHDVDELLRAIDDELAKLRASGVADDELGRAQTATVAERIFALERGATRANQLALFDHYVHRPDYLPQDLARYRSATGRALQEAAIRWLPEHARVVTRVVPTQGARVCGEVAP